MICSVTANMSLTACKRAGLKAGVPAAGKKADKSPALNPDLWAPLLTESEKHEITYHWLKGHAGHPENERCDRMAVEQSKKIRRAAGLTA